jgi:hypothetical protein
MICRTWVLVRDELWEITRAASPATCGLAMLVPFQEA